MATTEAERDSLDWETQIGVRPMKNKILIDIYDTGEETISVGGKPFFLLGDNNVKSHHNTVDGKHPGIRPRWARVLAVSKEAHQDGVQLGDHVLCATMSWSKKIPRPDGEGFFSVVDSSDIVFIDETKRS